MSKSKRIFLSIVFTLLLSTVNFQSSTLFAQHQGHDMPASSKDIYYCPMHPTYTSDRPGDCPICNMKLVKKKSAGSRSEISEKPALDGVHIDAQKQQLIGVKKEAVEKRRLTVEISTVGRIAYDPQLYVAQQEYIEALNAQEKISHSDEALLREQAGSLVEGARSKLLLMGLSVKQIEDLAVERKADSSLYLPIEEDFLWVYMTIYEYESGLVKEGDLVEIDAVAYPGETFQGEVVAIAPVLDAATRSLSARARIKNIENRLKPEMFVNAKINVDLGEKLAVPEEAVMDTGERKVVFVAGPEGRFIARDVVLGHKAGGYYEVLEGLSEAETVVTSGNFFIDSESKLKSAVEGVEHRHQ